MFNKLSVVFLSNFPFPQQRQLSLSCINLIRMIFCIKKSFTLDANQNSFLCGQLLKQFSSSCVSQSGNSPRKILSDYLCLPHESCQPEGSNVGIEGFGSNLLLFNSSRPICLYYTFIVWQDFQYVVKMQSANWTASFGC